MFLEPTCPLSDRAFGKLEDLLDQAGEDRITVKVRLQAQPWQMYPAEIGAPHSGRLDPVDGKTAAKSVMAAVAAHREEIRIRPSLLSARENG
jgi:hypothetical protein